jgi:N-acetylmuramoyl-L-alanine amidase
LADLQNFGANVSFLPKPYYLDRDDMVKFVLGIPRTGWTWEPVGITWHNTAAPSLKQWDAYPEAVKEAWGSNYDHYCKFDQRWHSGPHFCATPDNSFVLCEPRADGIHSTCFNSTHFGVETVGDFRHGADDPLSGRGLASMQNAALIIAALCKRMGWAPTRVVNFHRECTRDHHACPGDLVTDDWALRLVVANLTALNKQGDLAA